MKKLVVCIGAALIDETFICLENPMLATSNPSIYFRSSGGVACNIAQNLAMLGNEVELITHFGLDVDGNWLRNQCLKSGVGIENSIQNGNETGKFVAILSPDGELFTAVSICPVETEITIAALEQKTNLLQSASVVVCDCNLNSDVLQWILEFCFIENIPCIIDPVSVPKASRIKGANLKNLLLLTPNLDEMNALLDADSEHTTPANSLINKGIQNIWVRNGKLGSELISKNSTIKLEALKLTITDSTGAGDAALAGWIHAWIQNKTPETCLQYGLALASIILQTKGSLEPKLSPEMLETAFSNHYIK